MTDLIARYRTAHRLGSHCSSTLMSGLLRFYGHDLSEDLCFGLGAGLGFVYVRHPTLCIFGGRAGGLERQLCQHLGIRYEQYQGLEDDVAEARVRALVVRGEPVLCDVDMSHLPYLAERFRLTEDFRFGGHKVMVVGFDDREEQVFIYDYLWPECQVVTREQLRLARGSQIKPDPPRNTWFEFHVPTRLVALPVAVREAIAFNVQMMRYPVAYGLGLRALERFAREFFLWPQVMDRKRLERECFIAHMTFEKVGTGGGNFRRLYARFLRAAAAILQCEALEAQVYPIYVQLADLWKRFALRLQPFREELFHEQELRALLAEIAGLEREGLSRLQAVVGR
ncbi:MAG: BtrH N-terminal domain-containing protein [Symbiobacterium sp.]|uniref:BtrH N-terminal domain-containing protein n=1 Tax=Symbiobacterium sp. TaxID=1971213 RepID=UPI003463DE84